MQQFALATVRPRSIAWLIRLNEWERLETIVKYNCAMLGGYYNVLIPITQEDTLTEEYQRFLRDYDPDFVVLAPDMQFPNKDILDVCPFSFLLWDEVYTIATLDPLGRTEQVNATVEAEWPRIIAEPQKFPYAFVAVADPMKPDISRLAFIACGDVHPREPMIHVFDGIVELDANGYREAFLRNFLKPEYDSAAVAAHFEETDGEQLFIPAPDRYELQKFVVDKRCFPLSGIYEILQSCYRLQHHPSMYASFIGLTAQYKKGFSASQHVKRGSYPLVNILVSEQFGMREAILFWNLRAMEIYVAWLSFTDIENSIEELDRWLEADSGGTFYAMLNEFQIGFSTYRGDLYRLNEVVASLRQRRKSRASKDFLLLTTRAFEDFVFYDFIQRPIKQEHIPVMKNGNNLVFLPRLSSLENSGNYSIDVECAELLMPRGMNFTRIWSDQYERE